MSRSKRLVRLAQEHSRTFAKKLPTSQVNRKGVAKAMKKARRPGQRMFNVKGC